MAVGRLPGLALVGLTACLLSLRLPWLDPEYAIHAAVRMIMALAGSTVLLLAPRCPPGALRAVLIGTGVAAASYPTVLGLAAAGLGGAVLTWAAAGGHTVVLTLVQLLPVLAGGRARRIRVHRWVILVIGVVLSGTAATIGVIAGGPRWLEPVGSVAWFGSFLIAPLATWLMVPGSVGESRRRSVIAAVAALVPVVIICGCGVLGLAAEAAGLPDHWAMAVLFLGFSLGLTCCAWLVIAAVGPLPAFTLRVGVIVGWLNLLLGSVTAIIGIGIGLLAVAGSWSPAAGLLLGALLAGGVAVVWRRWHGWVGRLVDPAIELRLALQAVPAGADHAATALQVLRRVVDDPLLWLAYPPETGGPEGPRSDGVGTTAVDADHRLAAADDPVSGSGAPVVLARQEGEPTVIAHASTPEVVHRLSGLGDCSALLQPAYLAMQLARQTERADQAAATERQRLRQDLHDGLQGRLLAIALNLQLSGKDLVDPNADLLIDESVAALQAVVDEVRSYGGGRLPEVLVEQGLAGALTSLVAPIRLPVRLDLPQRRFAPAVEQAAWFVVSESLANALRHADPSRVDVRVRATEGRISVTVTDDGCGGADPRLGTGLRGLSERVGALGGVLVVRPAEGGGSVVEAVLPCGS